MAVYDDQDTRTKADKIENDELRNITGIGVGEEDRMESSARDGANEDISERQQLADDNDIHYSESQKNQAATGFNITWSKGITGAIIGLITGFSIAGTVFFTPIIKLDAMLSRINDRAMAMVNSAMQNRINHLAEKYVLARVIGLQRCGAVRSIDCKMNYTGMGMARNLFKNWEDGKMEEKLFDKFGLSVESTTNPNPGQGGAHKFTLRDRHGKSITFSNIDDWEKFKNGRFKGGSREFGREFNKLLKEETRWTEVLERTRLRRYLSRKHDVKFWCFWACKTKDKIDIKIAEAKTRMKLKFIEKFVDPVSSKYGGILTCLVKGDPNCTDLSKTKPDRSKMDEGDIADYAEKIDPDIEVKDVTPSKLDIPANANIPGTELPGEEKATVQATRYVIEKIVTRIVDAEAGKAAGQVAARAVPIIGWAYLGLTIFDVLDRVDEFAKNDGLTKMAAGVKMVQYIDYYTGMRTINDELKSGKLSLDEIGATMTEFDGAELSQVWQNYNGSASLSSLFGNKVFAQETKTQDEDFLCDDGKKIPEGQIVCNEMRLDKTYAIQDLRDNQYVDMYIDQVLGVYRGTHVPTVGLACPCVPNPTAGMFEDVPILGTVQKTLTIKGAYRAISGTINWVSENTIGKALSFTNNLMKNIPFYASITEFFTNMFSSGVNWLFGYIFPAPIQMESPGRVKYEGLEAGAEIVANEYAIGGKTEEGDEYGLGAPTVTNKEAATIMGDYYDQLYYEHRTGSLFTRLADIKNPYSFASVAIMSMPTNFNSVGTDTLNNIASIPSSIMQSISSLITKPASAASLRQQQFAINAFSVSRAGYKVDDPIFDADPEKYTEENCTEMQDKKDSNKTTNPKTGMEENFTANPCLLEKAVTDVAGSYFTDTDSDTGSTTTNPGQGPNGPVSDSEIETTSIGNIRVHNSIINQVNELLLAAQRDGINFGGGGYRSYEGQIAVRKNNCGESHYAIYEMPSEQCSPQTAIPGRSMHERGLAIDFSLNGSSIKGGSTGFKWLVNNASKYGLKNLPSEPWHWSTSGN